MRAKGHNFSQVSPFGEDGSVQSKRHHARRYPFVASIELTDMQSETQVRGLTSDLSLFGCHVLTPKPLPTGTRVGIGIVYRGTRFVARGRIVYAQPNLGMGVAFSNVDSRQQLILDQWIAQLRDSGAL